ncbi:hypothetical protein BKA65DRAFT_520150 [Rhexocercosporidium sp. MPI-PUGE-AT-0058]|nr:hypothetical protein BKA65DRAFT_520150 [Rhexocercosporidium sp. MPI-PUGE-AT-0058]
MVHSIRSCIIFIGALEEREEQLNMNVKSERLEPLSRDISTHLSGVLVFPDYEIRHEPRGYRPTLGQDMEIYPRRPHTEFRIAVKAKIADTNEADRIFNELAKINPEILGAITAIGVRHQWYTLSPVPRGLNNAIYQKRFHQCHMPCYFFLQLFIPINKLSFSHQQHYSQLVQSSRQLPLLLFRSHEERFDFTYDVRFLSRA